ncbi:restriction endonuclease subunit S [Collinsella sp. AM41-2BH]|uniref:restriction endonuclease subunit S n=1 Tax=Collinsella sp. AM41-2BH TaxID=2292320 RepID=UPI000E53C90F|nr:restriction endonuclease subunit S [Collinsella sp. AM41-2BH]RHB15835.1 restriction endonuclease subunit S [Collinsella sp. AM41-2BH]
MTEKTNVPEIRFAGFTDPWEQRKFSDLTDRVSIQSSDSDLPQVEYEDIIPGEGTLNKDLRDKDGGKTGIKFYAGDVLYGKLRPYLMNWLYPQFNGVAVGDFWVLRATECDSSFLYRLIQTNSFQRLANVSSGSKMPRADWKLISQSFFAVPADHAEQKAIAKSLAELDSLITLHQRKHDKLVQLKKSMLDKMFPKPGETEPEIRFAGFTDPWEQRKLGDICERHKEMVPTPKDGYVRMGVRSHAKGTFLTMVKPGAEIEEKELSRVKAHCLVVNIVFAWEQAIAITSTEDEKALVSHRFPQFLFHDDMHPDYFRYAILNDSFERHLWLASPSGAGRNKTLNVGTMLEYSFTLPNKKEQEAIASCLTRLDSLITLHQRKLELLRNTKKSLLERMFV